MIRRRASPDGLPFRVYERLGKLRYSVGYKLTTGAWAYRYSCAIEDKAQVAELRRKAIAQAPLVQHGIAPSGPTADLVAAWFAWQDNLPADAALKRAASTLAENRREARNIVRAFGHMQPEQITKADGYAYLDACVQAERGKKGNKEIALLQIILEYAVRLGRLPANPLQGIRKNKTRATPKRYVTDGEMDIAVTVGRTLGGSRHIVALTLKTAWLCVRRSVEARGLTRDMLTPDGIRWQDGKDSTKPPVLIEWTPELRSTIDELLTIKRNKLAGAWHICGNQQGQRYTKGGWKAMLDDLMRACEAHAQQHGLPFARFSLQDCRPKGVSDKLASGHQDTQTATGHTTDRMIGQTYDRRKIKVAGPVK